MTWQPISLEELYDQIYKTENNLGGEVSNFWELIKIDPEKWKENSYGQEGNGFWVVAICGKKVIWFNDIEEGFNISNYKTFGEIADYWCNQDDLDVAVSRLFQLIKFRGDIIGQAGPPQPIH